MNRATPISRSGFFPLATAVLVVAVLHFAQDILIPLALALLLTFLLAPIVGRLQSWGVPSVLSVTLTSALAFLGVGGLVFVLVSQTVDLVEELPRYRSQLRQNLQAATQMIRGGIGETTDAVDELKKVAPPAADPSPEIPKVRIAEPPPGPLDTLRRIYGPIAGPVGTAVLVVVFVVFMLLKRTDLRDRLIRLLGPRNLHATTLALDDAAARVSRFLLMQVLINGVQGTLVALGLTLIGVPNAPLWGALTLVLRFLPYVGPWSAALMPVALSLAVFDGWTRPLLTAGMFVALESFTNLVLEPWLYSRTTGVSQVALLVAAAFWTWLWGPIGLLLAIPLTVCLVVLGRHIPQLEFLEVLLGDRPALAADERLYQRLLADNLDDADDVIQEALQTSSLLEVCDTILVPALQLAEHDHELGLLDASARVSIAERIEELVEEISPPADTVTKSPRTRVIFCLPANDRAEETTAKLLEAVLTRAGIDARSCSSTALKGEMMELIEAAEPDAISICALPRGAISQARYLCKRLQHRFPGIPILVGLWNLESAAQQVRERFAAAGASRVVVSFRELVEALGVQVPERTEAVTEAPAAAHPVAASA